MGQGLRPAWGSAALIFAQLPSSAVVWLGSQLVCVADFAVVDCDGILTLLWFIFDSQLCAVPLIFRISYTQPLV